MFSFIFYGVILALFLLALAEIYLRIKYKNLLWIQRYPQVYVPDEQLGYRYLPNVDGEIRIPGIHRRFRTNNRGFHARDFVKTKTPGTYRIAVVGPSNTTGIWTHGQGKNFSEMLEDLYLASGEQVEVMNFGIDGRFRAVHELRIIEKEVAEYEPDLVLLDVELPFVYAPFRRDVYKGHVMIYNAENELSRKWCETAIDIVTKHKVLIGIYYVSYIVRAATRYYMNKYHNARSMQIRVFVENRVQAPDIQLLPYSIKKSAEAIQAVRDKLVERGADLIVLQYSINPYYRDVTSRYGLHYIELNVPPVAQFVHDRDGHYTHEGHAEVARQLLAQLIQFQVFRANQTQSLAPVEETTTAAGAG